MLNNQPMGFYSPATLVKDAQRHGLKVLPIDVTCSEWLCTLKGIPPLPSLVAGTTGSSTCPGRRETGNGFAVRLGLRYAKGLRKQAAQAIVRARRQQPFRSIDELARRVPELRKNELVLLAEIGALNYVPANDTGNGKRGFHRRDALWQVERASREPGPLLAPIAEADAASPLQAMDHDERLVADFRGTGLTVGPHPMAYRRAQMDTMNVRCAGELAHVPHGRRVRIAGSVIARQRPGTASGFVFLSLEDETGIANAIITPDLFEHHRLMLIAEQFLLIEGVLQNQDNVISVKAERVQPLHISQAAMSSHNFH